MNIEIVKVKSAEGETLERQELSSLTINLNDNTVNLAGNHSIKRADGEYRTIAPYANIQIPATVMPGIGDNVVFTESEVEEIQEAITGLTETIKTILNNKSITV